MLIEHTFLDFLKSNDTVIHLYTFATNSPVLEKYTEIYPLKLFKKSFKGYTLFWHTLFWKERRLWKSIQRPEVLRNKMCRTSSGSTLYHFILALNCYIKCFSLYPLVSRNLNKPTFLRLRSLLSLLRRMRFRIILELF